MAVQTTEEIVQVDSEDGIRHAGVLIRPVGRAPRPLPLVWTHGFTGRFYEPHTLAIGRLLAEQGFLVVSGNNRGHDIGAGLHRASGVQLGGGWWEKLDDAPLDIGAWISFAARLGSGQVTLLGHSLGGTKIVYYQSRRQDPRVRGLIAASPGLHSGEATPETMSTAEHLAAEGRGKELLIWKRPNRTRRISAQTLVSRLRTIHDLFGLRTPDAAISQIRCPLLVFYGTNEPLIGTAEDLETIRRNAARAARVEARMIEGADHHYTGKEHEVAALIASFVTSLE